LKKEDQSLFFVVSCSNKIVDQVEGLKHFSRRIFFRNFRVQLWISSSLLKVAFMSPFLGLIPTKNLDLHFALDMSPQVVALHFNNC
jgi:hypothetical protein